MENDMKRTTTAILLVVSILAYSVPSFGAEEETLPMASGTSEDWETGRAYLSMKTES